MGERERFEDALEVVRKLRNVIALKNRGGADWGHLFGPMMAALSEADRLFVDTPVQGDMNGNPSQAAQPDEHQGAGQAEPIDMVLHCPKCHMQHIDEPEHERTEQICEGPNVVDEVIVGWGNPPHRSHLCHDCGHIWRPADVPTNGVAAAKTVGKNDSPLVGRSDAAIKAQADGAERSGEPNNV